MGIKLISPELIVRDNLSENFWRQLIKRLYILAFVCSLILSSIVSGVLYLVRLDYMVIAVISFSFGLLSFLIASLLIKYATKPLWRILDTIIPFSRAIKANQIVPFHQAETEIIKQILSANNFCKQPIASPYATLNAALDRLNCGIIIINHFDEITNINNTANKLLNRQQKLPLIFDSNEPNIEQWLAECRQKEIHANHIWQSLELDTADQDQRQWFDIHANFNHNDENETILLITESLSDQKERQSAFEFTSYAAHELRGPITIIRGYLDILKTDFPDQTETGRVIIDRLIVAGNRLSGYINNILNAAKIDQRTFTTILKPTFPQQVINEVYDDISLRARTNQKELIVKVDPDLPQINIDAVSITQAITNLVDNAIKYSKDSELIELNVYSDNTDVHFQIKDKGIGMSEATLRNLFKRFYRSNQRQNQVSGTGIGLFITKSIVESNNGTISIDSKENEGSTFTISIPIKYNPNKKKNDSIFINNHGLIRK
ncbi:MAG: HAMP domain-containing sensor histidine kinase [Candidatus Saccharibacteria bacterium]|nr:HAMP domain-containing sensor histidine kinase [Candidatus Saccharibacteria bacterium]